MIYAYIRVSTHKQTTENQRLEIDQFCTKRQITIDHWISETITGTKGVSHRQLGSVMRKMRSGDILICSELSRLGRSIFMIMNLLSECMQRNIQLWTVKERTIRLGQRYPLQSPRFCLLFDRRTRTNAHILENKRGNCKGTPRGQMHRATAQHRQPIRVEIART